MGRADSPEGAHEQGAQICALSDAMQACWRGALRSVDRERGALLLWGESGVGKRTIARAAAHALNAQFEEFPCDGEVSEVRRWLFEIEPVDPEQDGPGLAGARGRRILYLYGLERAEAGVLRALTQLVQGRRYLDSSAEARLIDDELTIVGGVTLQAREDRPPADVVRVFGSSVRVPPLRERASDLEPLVAHLLGQFPVEGSLETDALELLSSLDYSARNGHQLRQLVERSFDVAKGVPRSISAENVRTAALDDLAFAAGGFEIRGESITTADMHAWIAQFPPDLQMAAVDLLQSCRKHYYCSSQRWWGYLRSLHSTLLGDLPPDNSPVPRRLILSTIQAPAKSEGRTLSDYAKAAGLPKWVQTSTIADLAALVARDGLPDSLVLVLVDDWMGSGQQMLRRLELHRKDLRQALKSATAAGRDLSVRLLCVACHDDALEHVTSSELAEEFGLRVHVAWVLDDTDRCVGDSSLVLPQQATRSRFETFATKTGASLCRHALGWPPGALLVMFPWDVPNNSLPLLWGSSKDWTGLRGQLRA